MLLVTRNFPPLVGGMEKLNRHLLLAAAPERQPLLCGPAGSAAHVPPGVPVLETRLAPLSWFLVASALRALRMAWRHRPRHVVAGSGLCAPAAWLAARATGAGCVVYLHGLDIIAPSRIYQWLWLPFIRACDLALVNSANTARLAREGGVRADRIEILHPGTELPAAAASPDPGFRARHGLPATGPILLSVGRFTRRKGLAEFVGTALPRIVSRHPSATLAVIGGEASDALHGGVQGERARIEQAARAAGVDRHVVFLGRVDEATLDAAYAQADVHVFPVLDLPGDVEGFGMVALEAAARGLPTVAFAVGGVPDAVVEGTTGRLVAPGDYEGLADAVVGQLDTPRSGERDAACRAFAAGKQWTVFSARLRDLLRALDAR
jgi:phosphatidylinositol alpha-1,6-mannosyltransferase